MEKLPIVTTSILVLNVAIHVYIFVVTGNLGDYSINPFAIVYREEWYRIISSALVHSGIFHIGMNMLSLLQLGVDLEESFGSLALLFISAWAILLEGFIYVGTCVLLASGYMTGNQSWLQYSGVGYSGVLFCYAIIGSYHSHVATRSFYGIMEVPSRLYPWLLLIVIQVVLPGISFLGHLSGILVGTLMVNGGTDWLLPSIALQKRLEETQSFGPVYRLSNWRRCQERELKVSDAGFFSGILGAVVGLVSCVWTVLEAALHIGGCQGAASSLRSCGEGALNFVTGTLGLAVAGAQAVVTDALRPVPAPPPWGQRGESGSSSSQQYRTLGGAGDAIEQL
jgi:membrane associated rhomboid family serine protease